jgi:hypothetical protein
MMFDPVDPQPSAGEEKGAWERPELVELPLRGTESGTVGFADEEAPFTTYQPS